MCWELVSVKCFSKYEAYIPFVIYHQGKNSFQQKQIQLTCTTQLTEIEIYKQLNSMDFFFVKHEDQKLYIKLYKLYITLYYDIPELV